MGKSKTNAINDKYDVKDIRSQSSVAIIIPLFNEEEVLPALLERINKVVRTLEVRATVYYIDDGSTDKTSDILQTEASKNSSVRVIQLSRNFGQQAALRAGLDEAGEDGIIFADGDLQDPPELFSEMILRWENGAEVVIAQRRSRGERGLRGLCFFLFHKFYALISHRLIPPNSGIFGLIDRKAADALRACPETNLYIQGLRGWIGFKQDIVLYDRPDRADGQPKQSFWRLIQYAWNAIASFSVLPLRMILVFGSVVSILSFLYGCILLAIRVGQSFGCFLELKTTGFTTLAVAIFFLGGIQLLAIGIMGEYLARTYDESKRRPLYLIRRRLPDS
jgi:polyisoprenyl-phosphate glycosyltransferase